MDEPLITRPDDSRLAREHPAALLTGYGIAGIIVAVVATWAFLILADEIPEHGWMARVDVAVSTWVEAHGTEGGETVFRVVSLFGAPILAAILVGTFAWLAKRRQWLRATALAVTCGGGALLNSLLKGSFHRARPQFAAEFHARSWSFPSGHAMASLIGYGFLSALLIRERPERRSLILFGATLVVGLIGFSRVYLGVHFVSDVLAGYCAGAVWLMTCIVGFRVARQRFPHKRGDG